MWQRVGNHRFLGNGKHGTGKQNQFEWKIRTSVEHGFLVNWENKHEEFGLTRDPKTLRYNFFNTWQNRKYEPVHRVWAVLLQPFLNNNNNNKINKSRKHPWKRSKMIQKKLTQRKCTTQIQILVRSSWPDLFFFSFFF